MLLRLVVKNALQDPLWNKNPDLKLNMVSYLGGPIQWPDGEVFGTFCVLDTKEREYPPVRRELLFHLRGIIESDLNLLTLYHELKQHDMARELQLREIHHRVKKHFNLLLSSVSLRALKVSSDLSVDDLLAEIQSRISTIAGIHQSLSESKDIEHVSLTGYLRETGSKIVQVCSAGTYGASLSSGKPTGSLLFLCAVATIREVEGKNPSLR